MTDSPIFPTLVPMQPLLEDSVFHQIVAILSLASLLSLLATAFRQPLIVAFIGAGILAGPDIFNIVDAQNLGFIETLAEFGIALLLFMVGLELDLRIIRNMGRLALLAGGAQVVLTTMAGFLVCLVLGFSIPSAVITGIALSFSSTIIVVKLLSDTRAADSLYGRVAIGILIVQDMVVIIVMTILSAVSGGESQTHGGITETLAFVGAGISFLIVFSVLFVRYAADKTMRTLARNGELMTIFCLTFAVLMAALCDRLHLSRELGGLLAGMMLASTPYNSVISARLHTLRDFLLLFFFAHLGAHLSLGKIAEVALPATVLSVFVLVVKPMIVTGVLKTMRFPIRIGFLAGVSLSQISEFSLILASMSIGSGWMSDDSLSIVTVVGLITMTLSSTSILHARTLYQVMEKRLSFFREPSATTQTPPALGEGRNYDILLFGLGRYGMAMAKLLQARGLRVLGIDFDPEAITMAQESGVAALYGDAADPEIVRGLPVHNVKVIVFSFHHYFGGPAIADLRRTLAKTLREHGYQGHIAATSHHIEHDHDLSRHGIDLVLNPFDDAAERGVFKIIETAFRP